MFEDDHAEAMLKLAKEHYENATPEEVREILIGAGIIYKNGRHTPPYRLLDEYWYGIGSHKKKKKKSS